jgi:hypothetical protein
MAARLRAGVPRACFPERFTDEWISEFKPHRVFEAVRICFAQLRLIRRLTHLRSGFEKAA